MFCDYCNNSADLVDGSVIYPHRKDLYYKFFYRCNPCDAYVGCHGKSKQPLGRLANYELRKLKKLAHDLLDPLWKLKKLTRSEAYLWLANAMNLDLDKTHIGMFDNDQCKLAVKLIKEKRYG